MINNNRQAGRRRGRGGQQQRPQGNSGRPDNGNRIDNRARGNASQLLEKYKTLARDAQMQGDRVNTEYYLQFADHYFRVLAETRSRFEDNRRQNGGAAFDEDEQEYDDDGEPVARVEQRPPERQNQGYAQGGGQNGNGQYDDDRRPARGNANGNNGDNDRGDRPERADRYVRDDRGDNNDRADRQNGDRPQRQANDRYERNDRPNSDRSNNDRPNNDRQGNDRQNNDRLGNDRGGNERVNRPSYAQDDEGAAPVRREERAPRLERAPRPERAPRQDAVPRQEEMVQPEAAPQQEEPKRRGRPRREVPAESRADAPVFEADRLPPSLGISAIVPDAEPVAEKKPRARRVRPAADESTIAE
ncbi:DUF4167 domain-containing protein [Sphingomonas sp. So64.6b]|uniref:DUF4167 domain-containing protein n=1 Tax=Sphingomonas sp. So64.6b TaxID=2997354 RepID=UPI001FCECE71|nr:DUF4167 domain-containing protein [Sphingomonas sp. So64.6b]